MSGFNSNQLFIYISTKMKDLYPNWTVGVNKGYLENQLPYISYSLAECPGGNYDMENFEGSLAPVIELTAFSSGENADEECRQVSETMKNVMLSYGFQCRTAPFKMENENTSVSKWIGKYSRIFASGDELAELF